MIAIAIRPLVVSVANVEVKVGLSTEGVPRPRADLNVTSMAKAFPNPALHNHPNSKLPGEKKVAPAFQQPPSGQVGDEAGGPVGNTVRARFSGREASTIP